MNDAQQQAALLMLLEGDSLSISPGFQLWEDGDEQIVEDGDGTEIEA